MILLNIGHIIAGFFPLFYNICLLNIKKPAIADTIFKVNVGRLCGEERE